MTVKMIPYPVVKGKGAILNDHITGSPYRSELTTEISRCVTKKEIIPISVVE